MTLRVKLTPRLSVSFVEDLQQIVFCCDEFERLRNQRDIMIRTQVRERGNELDRISRTFEALHDSLCLRVRRLVNNSIRNNSKTVGTDPLDVGNLSSFQAAQEWASKDIAHVNFKNRPVHEKANSISMPFTYLGPGQIREIRNVCEDRIDKIDSEMWE